MDEGLIETLAKLAINALTPTARRLLKEGLEKLEAAAEETKTPADDIIIYLLQKILLAE